MNARALKRQFNLPKLDNAEISGSADIVRLFAGKNSHRNEPLRRQQQARQEAMLAAALASAPKAETTMVARNFVHAVSPVRDKQAAQQSDNNIFSSAFTTFCLK